MRVIRLSDHPRDLLDQTRQQGSRAQRQELADYDRHNRQHQAELRRLAETRRQARASRQLLTWFRASLALRRARRAAPEPPRVRMTPSNEEAKLAAGIAGEQSVQDQLARVLNDDWVLLSGYHNRFGEIDHLLLGPDGLAAIEVKNVNGTVHCDGDHWRVVKFDRYGNQREEYDQVDRGGRSPSVQLNEAADELKRILRADGQNVGVLRIVQLTHRRAQVGTCRNPTVNIFTSTSQITKLLKQARQPLDAGRRARIEDIIITDHRQHAGSSHRH
jgi:hypothetical protein